MINSQPENTYFIDKQFEFTAYIRDPENQAAPDDVNKQRMDMYRTLIFNNVESFISSNFPVLRKIIADQPWKAIVQDFFSLHTSKTPYFSEIAEEFLHYLQYEREVHPEDPGFMLELAHYEWVEMAASIAAEHLPEHSLSSEQLDKNMPLKMSPLAWPLVYQYPVHKLSPEFQPTTAPDQPTFLLVFRDRDDEVRFLELTPVTWQMLQVIQENDGMIVSQCIDQLISKFNRIDPDVIEAGVLDTIKDLAAKDVIFSDKI